MAAPRTGYRHLVVLLLAALPLFGAACGRSGDAAKAAPEGTAAPAATSNTDLAFPGALGWAAVTKGGRGGQIIHVTTLEGDGEGSLREAIEAEGPRIIVFDVGGVIDLGKKTLVIRNPFVTIAGQTAPSPGITLIRGGMDIRGNDVIVQHIRIRPGDVGDAPGSGWGEDSISTVGAYNVIVDHCSLTWATDENLSASGPRFTGETPTDWRNGTSHNITFSNNIIGEGLSHSTHPKFEHSKGSLIHDNVTNILIYGNLYAHNYERSPLFKGGVHGAIVNNFIYDPGPRAIHYNLQALEWGEVPHETGRMTVIGNVLRAGPSTPEHVAFIMIGGDGDLDLYERDNVYVDSLGRPLEKLGRYTTSAAKINEAAEPLDMPEGLNTMPVDKVEESVLANAGARPWDRDAHDVRLLADVAEGRGEIIDSQEEVGGYPSIDATTRVFDPSKWNLDTLEPLAPDLLDASTKAKGT